MRTDTYDYGYGGAFVRKREGRALAHVCAPVALFVALLAVLLVPSVALADSSVIWGPSVLPSQDIGIVVNAPDKYRAAAVALGHTDSEISSWSDDVLAKLSNASTGGAFYTFAQKFGEIDDAVGSDNPLTAVVSAVGNSFWAIAETLYGDEIWLAGYSASEYESAAIDLASIINGGSVGGGGSSNDAFVGLPMTLTLTKGTKTQNAAPTKQFWFKTSIGEVYVSDINKVICTLSAGTSLTVPNGTYNIYAIAASTNAPGSKNSGIWDVFLVPVDSAEVKDVDGKTGLYLKQKATYYRTSPMPAPQSIEYTSDHNLNVPITLNSFTELTGSADQRLNGESSNSMGFFFSGLADVSVVPPTNWPEEPSAPSPPELPEPGTNPTVTPTTWNPVLSPSFDFDLNITADPTSSELIDWVQKIYHELKAFHTDAHDWAEDFGSGFTDVVQSVNSASSQLYSQLLVIDSSIHDEGLKIRNYMYQMFHWLKEQLNFQNDSFNDNNIVYWLKRIWSKLGSGDINLRPTDPTAEPDDWWDWLVKAIQNFLIGLAATSTELISEIADLASQVMHEFPFSIPWDIAAVLAALSTSPITPVFTITIPAVDGWWASFDFVIDMSPFDGAAETIRLMEKLLFTGLLIWKSKDLLDFMDVTKWFN